MSKFESIGVDRQYGARTIKAAKRALNFSCNKCSTIGRHANCEGCVIANAHKDMITFVLNN